ncbi:germin-like protein subfamily 3 member 2 [Senna tora]|uniref:Germin-like protein n=1 Tax=Senna tora TaxID=362788 RepID=A0A834TMX5_9FABA|nr:germin-like protein subfamily 3 member 2 [Senna tora]
MIVASASDPDPVMDFCIPKSPPNAFACKNASAATVEDFTFSGIKSPGNFKQSGFSSKPVNSNVFPGLNTLGMSLVRADLDVGGKVYSGFVDTSNRIFAKVIEKGEVMVFPRGLVHFQMNVGDTPATILGSFDSQNPGLQRVANAVFGSGIDEKLLEKAFGLDSKELSKLRKRFSS